MQSLHTRSRAIGIVNSRLAGRGETNAQKQGEQKRPGPFHHNYLLAIQRRRWY